MVRIESSERSVECDMESNEVGLEENKFAVSFETRKEGADALEVNNNKADTSEIDNVEVHTSKRSKVKLVKQKNMNLKRKTEMKELIQSLSLEKYLDTHRNILEAMRRKKIRTSEALKLIKSEKMNLEKCALILNPRLALKLKAKLSEGLSQEQFAGLKESMNPEMVLKAVEALLKLMKKEGDLFSDEENPVYMQITSVRMPITSHHPFFIKLPHSHLSESSDVCLITKDLSKNGKPKDFETTAEYYRKCLKSCGITKISEIITLRQLKREYEVYEMKRALFKKFDFFVIDRSIWGHAAHHLGRDINKRKIPVPVLLPQNHLKNQIDTALRTTCFYLHPTGNTFSFRVGHRHLEATKIRDNIIAASEVLRKRFPGHWCNILSLSIKGSKTMTIPLHLSVELSNSVEVPVEKPEGHENVVHFGRFGEGHVAVAASGKVRHKRWLKIWQLKKAVKKEKQSCTKVYVDEEYENWKGDEEEDL